MSASAAIAPTSAITILAFPHTPLSSDIDPASVLSPRQLPPPRIHFLLSHPLSSSPPLKSTTRVSVPLGLAQALHDPSSALCPALSTRPLRANDQSKPTWAILNDLRTLPRPGEARSPSRADPAHHS
ncbi:hypothetical protein HETIRDRAFT_454875 [Heterobasidion irregulare TC 32-1]|uniref:Uncharacterized protein n=1 Tax=Heterobasidion irregulare (strain TC 32-1) TaxID=747525 RepID=W4JVX8_HETIT|nr:uncharacterized protein HETIRDRAFT_454875 [Heterobasidion irregulare TC 32-1]ETW77629.1 hypothetical protein HETIRDRAFT_454875 [Heterobasidion irregulare TC 32-1]